jgi:dTDP-L-rhamnose 4-epimerase
VLGIDCYLPQVHGTVRAAHPRWESMIRVGEFARLPCPSAWDEIDAVIHLAAEVGVAQSQYQAPRYVLNNVFETVQLLDRVARQDNVRKCVVASSMSVYGEGEYVDAPDLHACRLIRVPDRGWDAFDAVWPDNARKPVGLLVPARTRETKFPEPASVYAQSKLDTERYALLLGEAYRTLTVALRFFNCFGGGQALSNPYTGVLAGFAARVLNGKPPLIYEDGMQSRDFIHVSDVARAVVMALEMPGLHGVFNVCTGQRTTVLSLAEQWCEVATERGFPEVVPNILGKYRVGDIRHCFGDPGKFKAATGFEAHMPMKTGLQHLADWIQTQQRDGVQAAEDRIEQAMTELRERGLER